MAINNTVTGQRIRLHRRLLEMSQENFAEACDVNRATVSCWERGTYIPDGNTIQRVAAVLGVSTDYLLGISDVSGSASLSDTLPEIQKSKEIKISSGSLSPNSAMTMWPVPVVPREFLIGYSWEYELSGAAAEFVMWPKDRLMAINRDMKPEPFAIYADDELDRAGSFGIHDGDKILIVPKTPSVSGALSLVMVYDIPMLKLVYTLSNNKVLLQSDEGEMLLDEKDQVERSYKFWGIVAGSVCNRPTLRPLVRLKAENI